MPGISIIICSCNRAAQLEATLLAFRNVVIPHGCRSEILIVDNASDDDTKKRAGAVPLGHIDEMRIISEFRKGKSNALNTALATSRYDILVFTDDDVRPAKDWLEQLCGPLLRNEYDAVVGRILLAPDLDRVWLGVEHKPWLASLEEPPTERPLELVGANMAFRRSVLQAVPAFDVRLGPGALGLGEDTLFSWQLREAGVNIGFIEQATVVHWPSVSRLRRSEWLNLAKSHGRKDAYLQYHWHHNKLRAPRIRWLVLQLKLFLRRILASIPPQEDEGCPRWEMSYVGSIAMCEQFLKERKRPFNYSKRKGQITF